MFIDSSVVTEALDGATLLTDRTLTFLDLAGLDIEQKHNHQILGQQARFSKNTFHLFQEIFSAPDVSEASGGQSSFGTVGRLLKNIRQIANQNKRAQQIMV